MHSPIPIFYSIHVQIYIYIFHYAHTNLFVMILAINVYLFGMRYIHIIFLH